MEDLENFLKVTEAFCTDARCPKDRRVSVLQSTLAQFCYQTRTRQEQGRIRQYLQARTGYSPSQISRHIKAHKVGEKLCKPSERHTFPHRYTESDRELLAETDNLHGRLNGAATRKICENMRDAGDQRFARLATISIAHLYNLRGGEKYRARALTVEKTNPTQVAIGKRCKPEPAGNPGYLRVDTVHQGDREGQKGVYHINFVDEVTQWQIVLAVEGISEQFLLPILQEALRLFPFKIENFHSDNGSEFINKTVARLLGKLLITQTKSRPRNSGDNGLVETKNGAVIRKHMGYVHIPGIWAPRINVFYRDHLIPYLNFARPCAFPTKKLLSNGKKKITYREYVTPLQKLLSLPHATAFLKQGMSIEDLKKEAEKRSPNQVAEQMQEAKRTLLSLIFKHLDDTFPSSPSA